MLRVQATSLAILALLAFGVCIAQRGAKVPHPHPLTREWLLPPPRTIRSLGPKTPGSLGKIASATSLHGSVSKNSKLWTLGGFAPTVTLAAAATQFTFEREQQREGEALFNAVAGRDVDRLQLVRGPADDPNAYVLKLRDSTSRDVPVERRSSEEWRNVLHEAEQDTSQIDFLPGDAETLTAQVHVDPATYDFAHWCTMRPRTKIRTRWSFSMPWS